MPSEWATEVFNGIIDAKSFLYTAKHLKFLVHIDPLAVDIDIEGRIRLVEKIKLKLKWENEIMFYCEREEDVERVSHLRNDVDILVSTNLDTIDEWAMESVRGLGSLEIVSLCIPEKVRALQVYSKVFKGERELFCSKKSMTKKTKRATKEELNWTV